MSTTIAEHVRSCLDSFKSIASSSVAESEDHLQKPTSLIKDEQSRFKVWTGNIAAHQRGKSSLDYRLRDASHLASQVKTLLVDLKSSLENACSILNGTRIPWDQDLSNEEDDEESTSGPEDDEIGFPTEMDQISADVAEVIDCLMNLSVSIRNPAPHDRFRGSIKTDTSFFEPLDIAHLRNKYEKADLRLVTLLGKANSRRRQYFKYRESHHQKLAQGLDVDLDTNQSMADRQSTIASSIPYALKTERPGLAETVDMDEKSDSGFTQTSYASSVNASDRPRFPALPSDSANGPFQCPFCFMMISVTTSYAWRKHIFSDLRPYSCVAVDCPIAGAEFGRRHEWMQHMLQNHWREWHCVFCENETFISVSSFRHHLEYHHAGTILTDELETAVQLYEQPKPLASETKCPFCHYSLRSAKEYRHHVGRHLEDLALFVLPKVSSDSENSEDEKSIDSTSDLDLDPLDSDGDDQARMVTEEADIEVEASLSEPTFDDITNTDPFEPVRNPEDDFSYITSEDLEDSLKGQLPDSAEPEDDILLIKHKGVTYPIHFPAYSIGDGKLFIRDVRDRVGLVMQVSSGKVKRIKMLYKGRQLKEQDAPIREYSVKNNSEILVVLPEGSPSDEDSHSSEEIVVNDPRDEHTSKRKSKNKRKKKQSPRDSAQNSDISSGGANRRRTNTPELTQPSGPLDKLQAIKAHFTTELLPLCIDFSAHPPKDKKKCQDEHRKLSETIMQHVLLKLDEVDAGGDPESMIDEHRKRAKVKRLIAELSHEGGDMPHQTTTLDSAPSSRNSSEDDSTLGRRKLLGIVENPSEAAGEAAMSGRQIENLERPREAISTIPQHVEGYPRRNSATSPDDLFTLLQQLESPTGALQTNSGHNSEPSVLRSIDKYPPPLSRADGLTSSIYATPPQQYHSMIQQPQSLYRDVSSCPYVADLGYTAMYAQSGPVYHQSGPYSQIGPYATGIYPQQAVPLQENVIACRYCRRRKVSNGGV